jgi:hypothetical protein
MVFDVATMILLIHIEQSVYYHIGNPHHHLKIVYFYSLYF